MKYSVSPKHELGTRLCCSYVSTTCWPLRRLSSEAIESERALKTNFSGAAPGTAVIWSSPSHVLHTQPRLETFWRIPARVPVEYVKCREISAQSVKTSVGTRTMAARAVAIQWRRTKVPTGIGIT